MGASHYRLLWALKAAGIQVTSTCRPNIAEFLLEGFETNERRAAWLRMAIFAVRLRDAANPGAYVKTLADDHVHEILSAAERALYEAAVARGFGQAGRWDIAEFLTPDERRRPSRG